MTAAERRRTGLPGHSNYVYDDSFECWVEQPLIGYVRISGIEPVDGKLPVDTEISIQGDVIVQNVGIRSAPLTQVYASGILPISGNVFITNFYTSITNEIPTPDPDNFETIFQVNYNYKPSSLRLQLNGIRQLPGVGNDYTETTPTTFTFENAPLIGDAVVVDYLTND